MSNRRSRCVSCRERSLVRDFQPMYKCVASHDGRIYDVVVENLSVLKCYECGSISFCEASTKAIDKALRKAVGLLQPYEIKKGRYSLLMGEETLAHLLGADVRYIESLESGLRIQSVGEDLLLRSFFSFPSVQNLAVEMMAKRKLNEHV